MEHLKTLLQIRKIWCHFCIVTLRISVVVRELVTTLGHRRLVLRDHHPLREDLLFDEPHHARVCLRHEVAPSHEAAALFHPFVGSVFLNMRSKRGSALRFTF